MSKARSKRCAEDRHAYGEDGSCTRVGCPATRTRDLFGRPLDAEAGPLFRDHEAPVATPCATHSASAPPLGHRARCLACGTVRALDAYGGFGLVGTHRHGPCRPCGRDWTHEVVA